MSFVQGEGRVPCLRGSSLLHALLLVNLLMLRMVKVLMKLSRKPIYMIVCIVLQQVVVNKVVNKFMVELVISMNLF